MVKMDHGAEKQPVPLPLRQQAAFLGPSLDTHCVHLGQPDRIAVGEKHFFEVKIRKSFITSPALQTQSHGR